MAENSREAILKIHRNNASANVAIAHDAIHSAIGVVTIGNSITYNFSGLTALEVTELEDLLEKHGYRTNNDNVSTILTIAW